MPALFSHKIKNRMLSAILLDGTLKGKAKLAFPFKAPFKSIADKLRWGLILNKQEIIDWEIQGE